MMLKTRLIHFYWLLSAQLGIDPRLFFLSLRALPGYLIDWFKFRRGYSGTLHFKPCLHDRHEEGGATKSEYFWQDLLVARWIFDAKPQRHIDIGSRVDGFVAHVASFREIEVFDMRPISAKIPGVIFKQADLMSGKGLPIAEDRNSGYCDSLSCLHAIEHFGLGRYGDSIDPAGYSLGVANMALLLRRGGTFYLSTPIGRARVEFNANRVFDPNEIIHLAQNHGLSLRRLVVIDGGGLANETKASPEALKVLAKAEYNLGMFVFTKG
jgi:hypothetical protein